jgi:hypothetical protein
MSALRYTSDGALAECPCCGSLDVGGVHDIVHCYSCGLAMKAPRPLQNAIDKWNRRAPVQPASERPTAADAGGLSFDIGYVGRKLALITRDLSQYTAQEMARELVRLAKVADEGEAVKEAQGLTDAKDAARLDLVFSLLPLATFCKIIGIKLPCNADLRPMGDWARNQIDAAIERMTGNAGEGAGNG